MLERFDQSVLRSLGGLGASLRDSPRCLSPHTPILPLRTHCCHRRLWHNFHLFSSSGRPYFRASSCCLSSIVHRGHRAATDRRLEHRRRMLGLIAVRAVTFVRSLVPLQPEASQRHSLCINGDLGRDTLLVHENRNERSPKSRYSREITALGSR